MFIMGFSKRFYPCYKASCLCLSKISVYCSYAADLRKVVVEINFKYDDLKIDICKTYEYDSDADGLRLHLIP